MMKKTSRAWRVRSGSLLKIVLADSPDSAAQKALKITKARSLAGVVQIQEWINYPRRRKRVWGELYYVLTETVLKKIGRWSEDAEKKNPAKGPRVDKL